MKLFPAHALKGEVWLPADKSVSQRAALFAALGEGVSTLHGYATAADPQSMLSCIRQLGIKVVHMPDGAIIVHGNGLSGLKKPEAPLDCGNSGTAMRFLAGVLAGQPFESVLVGDASLSRRPMARVANPLREMGAQIELTDGHAPIYIKGNPALRGIRYEMPVASAQVKSCVLLAGLFAEGQTEVVEKVPTRDHTERMLGIQNNHGVLRVQGGRPILAQTYHIPRDFSAAAFFMVAASIVPDSELRLPQVGLNPSRTGLLGVLRQMGADIVLENERETSGEPVADMRIRTAKLRGIALDGAVIANIIDEIPILAVAATQAEGITEIRGAEELRVKETDRIAAMVINLRKLGAVVEEWPDGMRITGGTKLNGTTVETFLDHRIAMSMGIAAFVADGPTEVLEAHHAAISFPDFWEQLAHIQK
ncbi:MAG: 3-phosphoshikimate 1-carboxyvinyltransferase [Bacteroidetes Order II. Incertae sedis bacterium]|nr:3-phosphoshikimate 1-carboxyvinyltransferase [Bacteroidetes Order II. bacterium]